VKTNVVGEVVEAGRPGVVSFGDEVFGADYPSPGGGRKGVADCFFAV
jgi:hypothetical protein